MEEKEEEIKYSNIVFFKQKTGYEMRISDWSSEVCSSERWCRAGRDADGTGRLAGIIRTTVEGIRLMSWELLADPQVWILLLTLSSIEIVLGIDNLVFISIAVSRLPPQQREDRKSTRLNSSH